MLYQIFTHEVAANGRVELRPFNADTYEHQFNRRSAALAWLIDWATEHGYKVQYSHDAANDAFDGIFYRGHECNEFAIQKVE